jgi:hypothetical protein
MSLLPYFVGIALLALAVAGFVFGRRRIRSSASNNWKNEAWLAREADGSWSENECAVGRDSGAPSSIVPGGI